MRHLPQSFGGSVNNPVPAESVGLLDSQVLQLQETVAEPIHFPTEPVTLRSAKSGIVRLLLEKRLRRVWQHSRHPRDKRAFNDQTIRVRNLLLYYRKLPGALTLWVLSSAMIVIGGLQRSCTGKSSAVAHPWLAAVKAEAFADTMESQFQPIADIVH